MPEFSVTATKGNQISPATAEKNTPKNQSNNASSFHTSLFSAKNSPLSTTSSIPNNAGQRTSTSGIGKITAFFSRQIAKIRSLGKNEETSRNPSSLHYSSPVEPFSHTDTPSQADISSHKRYQSPEPSETNEDDSSSYTSELSDSSTDSLLSFDEQSLLPLADEWGHDEPLQFKESQHKKHWRPWHKEDAVPTPFSKLVISQSSVTADCYLLAAMTGILSNKDVAKHAAEKMCVVNRQPNQEKFIINFKPNFSLIQEDTGINLAAILSNQDNLEALFAKGYKITIERNTKKEMVGFQLTVSNKKMKSIFLSEANANTNSLLVNVMEHFMGNLILLNEKKLMTGNYRRDSLEAHNSRRNADYESLLCHLFGYSTPEKHAYFVRRKAVNGKTPEARDKLLEVLRYYDEQRVGAHYGSKRGFAIAGYDDHARVITSLIKNKNNQIIGLEMINPWGVADSIFLDKILDEPYFDLTLYAAPT